MPGDLFIGRQPILGRDLKVVGYELLFRAGVENEARFEDGDQASSQVIVNTFMEAGLEQVVGSQRAYVNLTRPFLTGDIPLPMSPEQVALEVLEDIAVDRVLLDGLRRIRAEGYMIVLDDFRLTPDSQPLLELADCAKLDVLDLADKELDEHVDILHQRGIPVIAERVEAPEVFQRCRTLGCDYFQGYFFCRPEIVHGRTLPGNHAAVLMLLARLEDPDISIEELERLIVQDATLSYRLLRYINCATFALRRQIGSLREAILLLGSRIIRNWASLILFARLDSSKPPELLKTALVRARMCERLAQRSRTCDPGQAFTVGLFSTLDALLGRSMEDLLDTLPLTMPLKVALLERQGPLGEIVDHALSHEQGLWGRLREKGVDVRQHNQAYLEALRWAEENSELLRSIHRQKAGR